MKLLKVLAVISIWGGVAQAADASGFFVGAGAGKARMTNSSITILNPIASPSAEALPSRDTTNNVTVARLSIGYTFSKEWDLRLSYARFGEGEINFPGPIYPGIFFATTPDSYPRIAIMYRTEVLTLLPVYSIELAKRLRVSGGVGVNFATTDSHFETTRYSYIPRTSTPYQYADSTERQWSLAVQFGVEYFVMDQLSLNLTANYSEAKGAIPSLPMFYAGGTFKLKTTSVQGCVSWHF